MSDLMTHCFVFDSPQEAYAALTTPGATMLRVPISSREAYQARTIVIDTPETVERWLQGYRAEFKVKDYGRPDYDERDRDRDLMRSNYHAPSEFLRTFDPWADRAEGMRCMSCLWFVQKPDGTGRCRRHAPTMTGFPVVMRSDWCGDHRLARPLPDTPDTDAQAAAPTPT